MQPLRAYGKSIQMPSVRSPTLRAMPAPPSGCFAAVIPPADVTLAPIFAAGLEVHGYVAHRRGHRAISPEASGGNVVRKTYALAVARFQEASRKHPDALLFLDVQPSDLADEELFEELAALAGRVVLQLRGSGLPHDMQDFFACVGRLRAAGFRFALANLTGSPHRLALLVDLAPEFVKLDVTDLETSESKRVFLGALIATCRRLGAASIAEGVTSITEGAVLAVLGCSLLEMASESMPLSLPVAS